MRSKKYSKSALSLLASLPFTLLLFGCNADSPTAPSQQPVAPVTTTPASSTWNLSVSADPSSTSIQDGTSIVSNILVVARRSDNGQLVPNGTTALLRTSVGTLTSDTDSGQSIAIVFDQNGTARAVLNASATVATTVVVRAQIEQSFGTVNVSFLDVPAEPFQIASISPTSGPPAGNTVITLTGSGFEDPARASFSVLGQTLLLSNVRVESSSKITARTPPVDLPTGQNATASLLLENAFDSTGNPAGTDSISSAFTYTRGGGGVDPTTMKFFSLSPTSGPNEGGTRVTILGEGFGPQVQVYFTNGPLIESQIVSVSSTRIEAITASATGPNAQNANSRVDLRLVDSQTGASVTQNGAFQYGADSVGLFVSSIAPNQDEYLGGTLVTIFGQGFEEPVAVGLGGFGQQIISVTGTEIIVRTVPVNISCSSVSAPTTVTNIETNERIANGPSFTYLPIIPTITSVLLNNGQLAEGSQNGGTSIVIGGGTGLGRGFVSPLRVLINGVLASATPTSRGSISAITPAFTGTFATAPCTIPGPPPVEGTTNIPFAASVQVINLDTGCEDTLEGAFTYLPSDVSCHASTTAP